jgi:hypothetical protein
MSKSTLKTLKLINFLLGYKWTMHLEAECNQNTDCVRSVAIQREIKSEMMMYKINMDNTNLKEVGRTPFMMVWLYRTNAS